MSFFTGICLEGCGLRYSDRRACFYSCFMWWSCLSLFSFQRHNIFPSSDCCERQDVYDTEHVRYLKKKRKKAEEKRSETDSAFSETQTG